MARERRRQGRRGQSEVVSVESAYVKRKIPTYDVLNDDALSAIEHNADIIGAEIGVQYRDDEEVLDIWRQAGCKVEGETVYFEPGFLRDIIQKNVQTQFTQHARNSAKSVECGGDNMVLMPAYGPPFIYNLDDGRRYATLEDFKNFIKLAYMSPNLHHSGGTIVEPVDVPVSHRHLDMVYNHLTLSDKPLMGSVTAPERAQDSVDMAKIVFGEEFVRNNCVLTSVINCNSPLTLDDTMLGALKVYARNNQATIITPFILCGAMGPVTLAGAVSQVLIEAMSAIALTQLINPGCPVIMGTFTSSMSLRSGAPTFGMPEPALAYLAVGQLARRLGVPLRGGGNLTASKIPDYQAGQEAAWSIWPSVVGGYNYVMHSAGWLEGGLTMGYEKFILDLDQCGMAMRLAAGLKIDDNQLALDAYREVGPGKHYLGCAHTMANYQSAFYEPLINDSESFEQWRDNGSQRADERANKVWKKMLDEYSPPPIDEGVREGLDEFVERRKSEIPASNIA